MSTPRLTLVAIGTFGAAVAERLAEHHPGSAVLDGTGGTHLATWPALDMLVLAAGYDDAGATELMERAAFAWRRPWLPVLLEPAQLRCGPVVVPGHTACHGCFRRRRCQHARRPDLWPDREPDPVAGAARQVSGFAPHHVGIAVALARAAVRDAFPAAGQPPVPAGWVRTVSLVDGSVARAGVLAVDGCSRCRDPRARQRGRLALVAALRAALAAQAPPEPAPPGDARAGTLAGDTRAGAAPAAVSVAH